MAKTYNMTDKLSFDENPILEIRGELFEINADANTLLQIMGDFDEKNEVAAALSAYNRLFSEGAREKIAAMKLPMRDLMTIIQTAITLAQGEDPDAQEEEAPRRPVL